MSFGGSTFAGSGFADVPLSAATSPSPPPPPPPTYPFLIQMLNFIVTQSDAALLANGDDDNANASEDAGFPWLVDNSTSNGPGTTMGPGLPNGQTTGTPGPTRPTTGPKKVRRVRPGGSGVMRSRRVPAPVIILTITADDQSKNVGQQFTFDGTEYTDDGLE